MNLILFITISLFSTFFTQTNFNKRSIQYDYIVPSKTTEQLEERIKKMKEIVLEEELRQKLVASFMTDNKPMILQKKLVCEGNKALYTDETSKNHSLKIGEYNVFFDVEKKEYLAQSYIFNKPFIVEKEIIKLNWTYPNETKQIGAFKAKKAIAKKDTTFFAEVWYTTDLPAFPIENLFGLKGGVVEANFAGGQKLILKNFTTTLSKDDVIKKPSEGKKMSEKEFNILNEQKIKEVNEHAKNSRKN
jgi:GLPGLI family protein